MSRVGKKPITIPSGVTVSINDGEIEVKGPKGTLKSPIPQGITFKQEEDKLIAERANEDQSAFHGLGRALANNAIVGVTEGFKKEMDLVGVGYKAEAKTERVNTKTTINQYQLTLTLTGIDKQKLGQVAAELNRLRKPDAYKGKGVRYADKYYRLKPGKTGK
jgi:large subunit ribosomal protein L6